MERKMWARKKEQEKDYLCLLIAVILSCEFKNANEYCDADALVY